MVNKRNVKKRIKIVYKKLGREKIYGHADDYPLTIDSRIKGLKKIEIIIHECLHYLQPELSEGDVVIVSVRLARTLWYESVRFTDNTDTEPLQDEINIK